MATKTNRPDAVPDVQQTDGQQTGAPSPELLPIEQHREQLKIKIPVFIGVCAVNGWKPGKVMTETEFRLTVWWSKRKSVLIKQRFYPVTKKHFLTMKRCV